MVLVSGCQPVTKSLFEKSRNIIGKLTIPEKLYCERDSDCGVQSTCVCCPEARNKKYVMDIECGLNISCVPCRSREGTSAICVNNQCELAQILNDGAPESVPEEKITKIEKQIEDSCEKNNECSWVSTNCCPEHSGAYWGCINIEKSSIPCSEETVCETSENPKPTQPCACIDNKCTPKEEGESIQEGIISEEKTVQLGISLDIILNFSATENRWSVKEIDSDSLKLIDSRFESDAPEPCTGCRYGGISYFEFLPLKLGTTDLSFYTCDPWNCEETSYRIVKYKIIITNIPEEKYCEKDDDCMKACLDCCICNRGYDAFNKRYIEELGIDPEGNCEGRVMAGGCDSLVNMTYPICEKNTCILISMADCDTESDCVSSEEFGCVSKTFCDRIDSCKEDGEWGCMYCKFNFCSDDPS